MSNVLILGDSQIERVWNNVRFNREILRAAHFVPVKNRNAMISGFQAIKPAVSQWELFRHPISYTFNANWGDFIFLVTMTFIWGGFCLILLWLSFLRFRLSYWVFWPTSFAIIFMRIPPMEICSSYFQSSSPMTGASSPSAYPFQQFEFSWRPPTSGWSQPGIHECVLPLSGRSINFYNQDL